MKQLKRVSQLTLRLVSWIPKVFTLSEIRPEGEYRTLLETLSRVLKTRGALSYIKYVKDIRASLMIFLAEEYPRKRIEGVKVTREGIPLVFGPLIESIRRGSSPVMQMINTILFSTRAVRLGKDADIKPIIGPSLGAGLPNIGKYARSFWIDLGYRTMSHIPKALWFKKYHLTSKAGPNGQALWSWWADLTKWEDENLHHLYKVGGPRLEKKVKLLLKWKDLLNQIFPGSGESLRKLTAISDRELKVRVIAIGDYFTQTALRPLHQYLFRVLKKIPQDCTFDQASFTKKIIGWEVFYSIDLSNATDRFPIDTIFQCLAGHLPKDYLESWKWLMVGLPFNYKGEEIRYSVGNPMGFYSSWASFAVAHHYVMYYCCREINISWKDAKYVLLGDDILIGDSLLANKYKEVITALGVEFSPLKTHESKTLLEFAKRYLYKGQEISPFPVSALEESRKRYYLLVNLFIELEAKGWVVSGGISAAIHSFYEWIDKKPARYRAKFRDETFICEPIMRVMRGSLPADMALNTIIRQFGYPIRPLTSEEGSGILSNVAVETFAASNPLNQDSSKGKPLGEMAIHYVCLLTGIEDERIACDVPDIIQALPLLSVYGQIEEAYMNISKEAYRIDTTGGGDWPMLLKTMALPLNDEIFVMRSSHLISRASSQIGNMLRTRLEFLASPMGRSMLG